MLITFILEIIPSSARSTASTAIPLPPHLQPLLSEPLERLKLAVDHVLPRHKAKTALEEAMYEDEDNDQMSAEVLQSESKVPARTRQDRLSPIRDTYHGSWRE